MHSRWPRLTGLALALVAAALSNALLGLHAHGSSDLGLLAEICGKGGAGCEAVVSSRWGVFPPGPPVPEPVPPGDGGAAPAAARPASGIPVAALGLFYYTLLAVWFAVVGRPSGSRRRFSTGILAVGGLGVAGSLFYTAVMLFALDHTCVLCLGTHVANFLIAPILWATRARPVAPPAPRTPQSKGAPAPEPAHPDTRLALTAGALVLALCAAEWKSYRALFSTLETGQAEELRAALDEVNRELAQYAEIASDVERLDGLHLDREPIDIGVRADNPRIAKSQGLGMQLVIFGDIECPNCARYDEFLFGELIPLFSGHLDVVFKHFPLREHAHALPGARALEAARLQGNDQYWAMHHYLAERRETLASVDFAEAARAIGLDVERFQLDLGSAAVQQRISEDIAKGNALELKGTPGVFLNGRPVNRVIRSNIGWWKLKADMLRGAREKANQPW